MEAGTDSWRAYVGLVSTKENIDTTRDALLIRNNSPYTTDPVSERVVEMVKGYTELPLNNAERWFGEMAMYVRKN